MTVASRNFLKYGINFFKKYGNIQNALRARKAKVLESLLGGGKQAYRKKKSKKYKMGDRAFRSEYTVDIDYLREWSAAKSRPRSDNDKSDFEYESSEDSMIGVKGQGDGCLSENDNLSNGKLSDNDDLSNQNARNRKLRKIINIADLQKQIKLLKKFKINSDKSKEKKAKAKEEINSKPLANEQNLADKLKISKDSRKGTLDLDNMGDSESDNFKATINNQMKDLLKNNESNDKASLNRSLLFPNKSDDDDLKSAERQQNKQKSKTISKISLNKASKDDVLDINYLYRALMKMAEFSESPRSPKKKLNLLPFDSPQKRRRFDSLEKPRHDDSSRSPKMVSKIRSKTEIHSKTVPELPDFDQNLPKDLLEDIMNKRQLLQKTKSFKLNLADTLRDHTLARERKKTEMEGNVKKAFSPIKKDSKTLNSVPSYGEINQFANTPAKVDSWNPNKLTDFVTLNRMVPEPEPDADNKKEEGKNEYEKELFDPTKNFIDILARMFSLKSKSPIAQNIETANTRSDIHTIREMLVERKKEQVQVSKP